MIYSLGIELGLSVADIDSMTAGEIIDLLYYKANRNDEQQNKQAETRQKATQSDYDSF